MKLLACAIVSTLGCVGCVQEINIQQQWHLAPWRNAAKFNAFEAEQGVDVDQLGGRSSAKEFIIDNQEEWAAAWKAEGTPAPKVDFAKNMIVGLCHLTSYDGMLTFYIQRIEKRTGGAVVYVKKQIAPPGTEAPTVVFGTEADYALVQRTPLPFLFVYDPFWIVSDATDAPASPNEKQKQRMKEVVR